MVKQKSAKTDDRALAFHYRDHMHTWRLAYEKSEKRATSAESELTTLRAELLEARKRLGEIETAFRAHEAATNASLSTAEMLTDQSGIDPTWELLRATIAKEPGQ